MAVTPFVGSFRAAAPLATLPRTLAVGGVSLFEPYGSHNVGTHHAHTRITGEPSPTKAPSAAATLVRNQSMEMLIGSLDVEMSHTSNLLSQSDFQKVQMSSCAHQA